MPGAGLQAMQLMQYMQAMHQMMALYSISSQYQMQVRHQVQELMKLRMMQQLQEMSYMQQAQAMQEVEAFWQTMQPNGGGSPFAGFDPTAFEGYLQDHDGTEGDGEVLQAAQERLGSRSPGGPSAIRKSGRELPSDQADLEAKIQETLKAAMERGGPRPAAQGAAALQGVAKASVEAKVAEALAAARERSSGGASPTTPAPANSPTAPARPAVKATAVMPASPEDLQAKIAEAVEAARMRGGVAKEA